MFGKKNRELNQRVQELEKQNKELAIESVELRSQLSMNREAHQHLTELVAAQSLVIRYLKQKLHEQNTAAQNASPAKKASADREYSQTPSAVYMRKWRAEHPEQRAKANAYARDYHQRNKEKAKAYARDYYQRNKERLSKYYHDRSVAKKAAKEATHAQQP